MRLHSRLMPEVMRFPYTSQRGDKAKHHMTPGELRRRSRFDIVETSLSYDGGPNQASGMIWLLNAASTCTTTGRFVSTEGFCLLRFDGDKHVTMDVIRRVIFQLSHEKGTSEEHNPFQYDERRVIEKVKMRRFTRFQSDRIF